MLHCENGAELFGYEALFNNQTGGFNTANGAQALYHATGRGNIALGFQAGRNLTTGNNNIDIGNAGVAGESNKIRIGKQGTHNGTFIAGIRGATRGRWNSGNRQCQRKTRHDSLLSAF
jgi:trimeric autotransporter adhesin